MWNKRSDDGIAPRPQPETAPRNPIAGTPMSPPVRSEGPVVRQMAAIGPSMFIRGDISTDEELLVDGEVEGSLGSHSLLTVGPHGKVRANIKAREVIIYGSVHGNVEVSEKIAIRDHGSLVGDIRAAGISIDDGAYFKGSIDIVRPEPKAKPVRSEDRVETTAAR